MDNQMIERVTLDVPDVAEGDRDKIMDALSGINGVRDVEVVPDAHEVEIAYDPREVNMPKLQEALSDSGYNFDLGALVRPGAARPGTPSETE
jgi:copper chaperone CopZ